MRPIQKRQMALVVLLVVLASLVASCAPAAAPTLGGQSPVSPPASASPVATPTSASPVAAPASATPTVPRPTSTPTPAGVVPAQQPSAGKPKKGGVLTYGAYNRIVDHDPYIAASLLIDWDLAANGLLDLDNDTQAPKPDLAERWEVSKDGTVYTFYLRRGVRFQNVAPVNGRPLTAEDVVYSFNRIRTNDPRFARRSLFTDVTSIKALDSGTVQFTLKAPFGPFLFYVANQYNKIVAKEVVDKFDGLQAKMSAIGTGPYILKTWREPFFAEMVRNTDYWDKDRPNLDSVRLQVIEDNITRAAALRTGQVDIAGLIPPSAYEAVKSNPNLGWDVYAATYATALLLQIQHKPWDDVRVRRAMHLAIDRDNVVKGAHEGSAEISGPLAPFVYKWAAIQPDELRKMPGYRQPKDADVAEAKRLLAEAGYPNGFDVTMLVTDGFPYVHLRPAEVISGNLAKIGVKVSFRKLDTALFLQAEREGNFEMMVRGIVTPLDPDAQLAGVYSKGGSRNVVGLFDPQLEDMLAKGRSSLDREERKKIYRDVQMLVMEKAYRVYMDEPFDYTGKQKYVRNYNGQWVLDNRQVIDVWLDK